MLARTPYLTAQELGVREIEHEYLSRFVSEGEQGKLPEQHKFDITVYFIDDHGSGCGTVGCIAGTIELYARREGRLNELRNYNTRWSFWGDEEASKPLSDLFNPIYERHKIGIDQAVSCTKHFLQTGVVDWPLALGERA